MIPSVRDFEQNQSHLFTNTVDLVVKGAVARLDSCESIPTNVSPEQREAIAETVAWPNGEPPLTGQPLTPLINHLFGPLASTAMGTMNPGFLAYIPSGALPMGATGEFISALISHFPTLFETAPGLTQIELNVIKWLCNVVGFPDTSFGILTSGGSIATFEALATARITRLGDDIPHGVLYTSSQVHHSVQKAAVLCGLPLANVHIIPTHNFAMQGASLREAVIKDRANGLKPFAVVASAGTTNTGAIDDMNGIADVCQEENLWMHVDGAYGALFCLCEEGKRRLAGIERADSITLDPHKTLCAPYGIGALVVRRREDLFNGHNMSADYMPEITNASRDFCHHSMELSRNHRGLKVYLPLMAYGVTAFRRHLEEKMALSAWACEEMRQFCSDTHPIDGVNWFVEIVAESQLSLFAFKAVVDGRPQESLNALNLEWLTKANDPATGIYLSGTTVDGSYILRVCVLQHRTHHIHVKKAVDVLQRTLVELLS